MLCLRKPFHYCVLIYSQQTANTFPFTFGRQAFVTQCSAVEINHHSYPLSDYRTSLGLELVRAALRWNELKLK